MSINSHLHCGEKLLILLYRYWDLLTAVFLHKKTRFKVLVANQSREMEVLKAFRPIRRDLPNQISFNKFKFLACKLLQREKFRTKSTKIPGLLTMAQGSTSFEHLEKPMLWSRKTEIQELRRRGMRSYSLNF